MGSVGGASAGSYDVPTIVRPSQGTRKRKRPSLFPPTAQGTTGARRSTTLRARRSGAGARPSPPRASSSSAQGPAALTTMRARTSEVAPPSVSRTATPATRPPLRSRETASAWFAAAAPASAAAWRKPSVSRSVLAACASCQRAAPVRPRGSRPGTRRSASAAETVRAAGMRWLGGRPRLRSRVSQSFRRRPSARASRPVVPWP